jgi:15-cis-phytoene synthase
MATCVNPADKTEPVWSDARWEAHERETIRRALQAASEQEAHAVAVRQARHVLRTYSTSFFVVTRFLPPAKRADVECIYAAVRYPDEVVDTFAWDTERKLAELDAWAKQYERGTACASLREALAAGVSCHLAPFTQVVRRHDIPREYYLSFLEAMRLDVTPRPFADLPDLIDAYVYGSAVVVGYFLTHVYGAVPGQFDRAIESARKLGIALQLTNFLRDIREDHRRGRLYIPLDMLRARGVTDPDPTRPAQRAAFEGVVRDLCRIAQSHYDEALADLDAFAPDSRVAIRACVRVYGRLNARISQGEAAFLHRASVPFVEKFRLLPMSKYWRLPIAYLSH